MLGFLEAGYGNIVLAVVCVLGMAGTWLAGRRYRRLILQTDDMTGTQSKVLKQLKNKFETSYRINQGVNNVGLFVERNVREFRFLGMKLSRLGNTAAGAGSLIFLLGCAAALFCYRAGTVLSVVSVNLAGSMFLSAVALVYWKNAGISQKAGDFCIHIQDYLENVLSNRLAASAPKEQTGSGLVKEERGQEQTVMEYGVRDVPEKYMDEPDKPAGEPFPWESQERGRKRVELSGSGEQVQESHGEEIEYLRQSLDRIASGREPQRDNDVKKRKKPKLSTEEQALIEDILREYFA